MPCFGVMLVPFCRKHNFFIYFVCFLQTFFSFVYMAEPNNHQIRHVFSILNNLVSCFDILKAQSIKKLLRTSDLERDIRWTFFFLVYEWFAPKQYGRMFSFLSIGSRLGSALTSFVLGGLLVTTILSKIKIFSHTKKRSH